MKECQQTDGKSSSFRRVYIKVFFSQVLWFTPNVWKHVQLDSLEVQLWGNATHTTDKINENKKDNVYMIVVNLLLLSLNNIMNHWQLFVRNLSYSSSNI